MSIELIAFYPTDNKSEFKRFIDLPWSIYQNDPNWVAPLKLQVIDDLDVKKNPFYRHADIQLWNAYKAGKHVGRIAAIHDERHNEVHNEKVGFFGFFESIDDFEVAAGLFSAAEKWVAARGLTALRGPANPSFNHSVGIQLSAYDTKPYVMMTHNPKYYPTLLEKCDFKKAKDLLAYEVYSDKKFPEVMIKLAERIVKKNRITYRPLNMKKFKEEARTIQELYNNAWEKNWGFVPMDDLEFDHMAKSLKDIIWPDFCLLAEVDGRPIAFSITLPDVNQVLERIPSGKILPFGIFKLLFGMRPKKGLIDRARVIILGAREEYRATGIASLLFYETYRRAPSLGIKKGEVSWVLEDNKDMRNAAEMMAGQSPYKTYRIYEKAV